MPFNEMCDVLLEYRHTVNKNPPPKKHENLWEGFPDFPSNYCRFEGVNLFDTSLKKKNLKKEGIEGTKEIETKPTLLGQDGELCFSANWHRSQ